MKLQCLVCSELIDIIAQEGYIKRVKCSSCGFCSKPSKKEPEVFIRKSRISNGS